MYKIKSSLSGGTIASVVNLIVQKMYQTKGICSKPIFIKSTGEIYNYVDQSMPNSVRWDGQIKKWSLFNVRNKYQDSKTYQCHR